MAVAAPGREAVALKAFRRIAQRWRLNREQQATLLAASPRSIDRWKKGPERATLTKDQFERISYLLGIYGGLHAVLGDSPLANEWVMRENVDFGGRTPLDRMLAGNVGDLAAVRHYVDQWRAGW